MIFSATLTTRKILLRYFSLPRFIPIERLDKDPNPENRHFFQDWEGEPFYVKPTFLNRWGPRAWYTWIRGLPIPGDSGDKYYPHGYYIPDVGPKAFEGKGREQLHLTKERLRTERTGQCPFTIVKP